MKLKISLLLCFLIAFQNSIAQKPQTPTPSEIYFKMEQLNVLASALYIAAHPDDENTRLITYLTHHEKAYTNYLSLTRGNGGQNLISNELGTDLGVIRTNELWNARKIDGGKQFFSTANDFGFSKHPKEAFEKWDKELLLQQMVYLIRKEQPDVIVNRFDHRTEGNTHGHHTASAQLSKLAFALASDQNYKNLSKEDIKTWQPKRLFFNVSWFFFGSKQAFDKADKSKYIPLNIGVFYNQLGKNNQEIASLSRSQHQSQGFGDISSRGEEIDYVELVDGSKVSSSNLFEGIDTSWNRIEGGKNVQPLVTQLIKEYDFKDPSKSILLLTKIYSEIDKLPETIWKTRKQNEVKELIKNCAGLFLDVTTDVLYATPNEKTSIKVEIANRSNTSLKINTINILNTSNIVQKELKNQEVFYDYFNVLLNKNEETNFTFLNSFNDFKNQFKEQAVAQISVNIFNVDLTYTLPIQYHYKDVVKGEIYKPFHIVPEVSVQFQQTTYIQNSAKSKATVLLTNYAAKNLNGTLVVLNSKNKEVIALPVSLQGNEKNKEVLVDNLQESGTYSAYFKTAGQTYSQEVKWIDYQHIPLNYYFKPAETTIVSFNSSVLKKKKIGYIMGAGDEIAPILKDVGYQVELINLETIKPDELSKYETIIVGIRAFNTESSLKTKNKLLFDYTKNGGTVIVQYQTNTNLQTEEVAPYKLTIGKTRVTDENAVVHFINPNEAVLNKPFKITQESFKNWVQEQGLYYADAFSNEFQPVFSSHDFDEKSTNGALIIAKYGKGHYVYTGLSFFRQLPIGNVGALELFINLIELKNE
ncbi:PIG-L family deacetylase [Flavobacterium sp. xlx-214]|uniref:PIG-L family deacetylase n=1 Tax=unclassified Flavobacterium TaxID=196869 RepID=UPI0013D0AEB5|nr:MULTISPECIES: PIG-L family deacetylase [unclassified Flavobacterium]MBA5793549.1 PIG-L family deacetylase [Flavobacterium sp. xlx-221]QMI82682.1 PIG-L family deacetylase [Flavobacterium sp. xlx-214]